MASMTIGIRILPSCHILQHIRDSIPKNTKFRFINNWTCFTDHEAGEILAGTRTRGNDRDIEHSRFESTEKKIEFF